MESELNLLLFAEVPRWSLISSGWSGDTYIASTMSKQRTSISRAVNWTFFTLWTALNKCKKKKVKLDLAGMGRHPKALCFGLYSLHKESEKYPDFNAWPNRVVQSLWRWDVELENVNRCQDILMHFWKDKLLSFCYILEFTPSPYQKYDAKSNSHFISISQSVWRAKGTIILC